MEEVRDFLKRNGACIRLAVDWEIRSEILKQKLESALRDWHGTRIVTDYVRTAVDYSFDRFYA